MKTPQRLIRLILTLVILAAFALAWLFIQKWLGILTIVVSIAGVAISRQPFVFLISLLNISLGIAFDYFIRVAPYFHFYSGFGTSVEYMCLVSGIIYATLIYLDSIGKSTRGLHFNIKLPEIGTQVFPLLAIILFSATVFIVYTEQSIFSSKFSLDELQKYPLLEYASLICLLLLLSAKGNRRKTQVGYAIAIFYIAVCLATSYRMVAIITTLALGTIYFENKPIPRISLVILWLGSYILLTYISYIRIGIFEVTPEMILGYQDGRLDNTFTGVIETGLIYTEIAFRSNPETIIKHFIGVVTPLPNTFIPNAYIYSVRAIQDYIMPGGGIFAAFAIYFNYTLVLVYCLLIYLAATKRSSSIIAGSFMTIITITSVRWWLYGPFVVFKYFGIFMLLLIVVETVGKIFGRKNRDLINRLGDQLNPPITHSENSFVPFKNIREMTKHKSFSISNKA